MPRPDSAALALALAALTLSLLLEERARRDAAPEACQSAEELVRQQYGARLASLLFGRGRRR